MEGANDFTVFDPTSAKRRPLVRAATGEREDAVSFTEQRDHFVVDEPGDPSAVGNLGDRANRREAFQSIFNLVLNEQFQEFA